MFNPIPFNPEFAIMCDPFTWFAVGTALASVVGGVINAFTTKSSNDKNLSFAKEQLGYEKELNENKYQINVADMQKSGLNPLNLTNASVSHSYHSANQQAFDSSSTISALSNIATSYMSNKNQKSIADASNSTQKEISQDNSETAVKVANINADVQKTKNEQEHELAVEQFKADKQREDALAKARMEELANNTVFGSITSKREFIQYWREIHNTYDSSAGGSLGIFVDWLKNKLARPATEILQLKPDVTYEYYLTFMRERYKFTPYKSKYED